MKTFLFPFILALFSCLLANAQNVNIPDVNFKAYLVGNAQINTNGDTAIQVAEAQAYSYDLYLMNKSISDLTGIEAFINIPFLNCSNNNLTSLDITSSMPNLLILVAGSNQLSSVNISGCIALTDLNFNTNNLTTLDLSNNTNLTYVSIPNNNLLSLDISGNPSISELTCSGNNLLELNVANGNNTNFAFFSAAQNPNLSCIQVDDATYSNTNWSSFVDTSASFNTTCPPCIVNIPDANFKAYLVADTTINTNGDTEIQCSEAAAYSGRIACFSSSISDLTGIEAFTAITELYCHSNSLTSLDLSNNTALTTLGCSSNSLTALDLSNNSALIDLDISTNNLSTLNVANGNNQNLPNISFNAQYNPNLTCIEVDDAAYSTSTWALIDAQTSFSESCATVSVHQEKAFDLKLFPNPTSNLLFFSEAVAQVQVYDLLGQLVLSEAGNLNQIDLSVLGKGVYLIHLNSEKGTLIEKIIKN